MRHTNILDTIGRTPVVRLNRLAPPRVEVYVKLEAFNPMGSVKDRLAAGVIERAEREGALRPGQTVVEATSGNTGIGLAMVCAARGYPLVVTMAENFSVERRRLMRFLGARVVLTPAAQKGTGMLAKARELAERHGWFLVRQFENEANADVHSRTTAVEILEDFRDARLDAWVTGYGSGGTLKGVARVLRERRPETRIVVCEPDNSQVLGSGMPQARLDDGSPAGSHPVFRPHAVQGWAPDFVPKLAEDALRAGLVDRILPVSGTEALELSRRLATDEGILAGISGGATLAGALAVARDLPDGSNVLCMLPDTGERYLSTPLFTDIAADMNDAEFEIARSTPGGRIDAPQAPPVAAAAQAAHAPAPDAEAAAFVEDVLGDGRQPVVLFALEWCEFCWSVRRLFERLGVAVRSVDLDSVAYQQGDRGGRIRAALGARTRVATIPQVFVGGAFVGGCTDTFDAWSSGRLQSLLDAAGVAFDRAADVEPRTFLPGWLQAR
ncbi:MAG: cysteine synthase A [Lysobacterales bacterium]|nr:MAG: cysteine synthase A [Xanthomonadales bacterium]